MCKLTVVPNFKDLGQRLGKKMKDVAKAIDALTKEEITEFMTAGVMEVCGYLDLFLFYLLNFNLNLHLHKL